jgi:hypothetical protein
MKNSLKAKKRLERRVSDYEQMSGTPDSKGKYVDVGGKYAMFHKPGSLKKNGAKGRGLK